jgi:HAD superfamily hydrolase (TIGR01490 family)
MEAAFFDLDKTVIAKASMMAFSRPLHRAGYLSRWLVLRALWGQVVFRYMGADEDRMEKMREASLRIARGWDQARVRALVEETLTEVIEPIVFDEALSLMAHHREQGRRVIIVSASPTEIVEPLARYLGVDEAIASRPAVDADGRYTGAVEFYAYGTGKAVAIRALAEAQGIDLERSYAYSDSVTDLPMLEVVGFPVAVNPDRELRRIANERGWDIRSFFVPVPLRSRVSMPAPRTTAAIGGGTVAVGLSAALGWWWFRHRRR